MAKWHTHQPGNDYIDTFIPVVKHTNIPTIIGIAISKSWPIHQLDVHNAFLHGHLTKDVFMSQPLSFIDQQHPNHVCHLKRALYSLKQTPRVWFQRLDTFLMELGFIDSKIDTTLFVYSDGHFMPYILFHVDDILLMGNNDRFLHTILNQLPTEFSFKDLGPVSFSWVTKYSMMRTY